MWIITVEMPEQRLTFKVNTFKQREGRILFKDKNGNPKNFPEQRCFIEGVNQ